MNRISSEVTVGVSVADPYFSTERCVERLENWYKTNKKLIVTFDFDDTVYDFHGKGYHYPAVVTLLRECQDLNFILILFSSKNEKVDLTHAVKYMKDEHRIVVDFVNESPVMTGSAKPYYNILLDDKSGLAQSFIILAAVVDKIKDGKL